jgi:hypothetical protein
MYFINTKVNLPQATLADFCLSSLDFFLFTCEQMF